MSDKKINGKIKKNNFFSSLILFTLQENFKIGFSKLRTYILFVFKYIN